MIRTMVLAWCLLGGLLLAAPPLRAADISGSGWRLWPDTAAKWQDDTLYLPDQVKLAELPVNPPTGGWAALSDRQGMAVRLPSTVEEHYWGKFGFRPYGSDYKYSATDPGVQNGSYQGVSWWWRKIEAPARAPGERLIVSFRGARLRAEVYCNGKLCAYTILTELPFDADITAAVRPGPNNVLAVRITNPGGPMDWRDSGLIPWGRYRVPPSHGFGGLDAGITMEVRGAAEVADLAVRNTPEVRKVVLLAEVAGHNRPFAGNVVWEIRRKGRAVWTGKTPAQVERGGRATVSTDVTLNDAALWDIDHPELYRATARLEGVERSGREREFGFRWFDAEGIGKNAKLVFNGKRIVVRSSISWGFWAPNGLWPDAEKAEREVRAAKAMGLNGLQFHRNVGKTLVLEAGDRLGLLRYAEPGGGKAALGGPGSDVPTPGPIDTSGKGGETDDFTKLYAEEKLLAMIRRDRSHPSLLIYCIQNELGPDLRYPRIFYLLRRMHALDPSRIVLLKSGIRWVNQAWMRPYGDDVLVDDGTGVSGWYDNHTVGGLGTYQDSLYLNPDSFSHDAAFAVKPNPAGGRTSPAGPPLKPEVITFGEMLGAAVPDDHQAIVEWYRKTGRTGYDRDEHERILAAYNAFLDRYGFRSAFPTPSDLFRAIGEKSYFFWQKMIEQCRFSNRVDYIVVSGWESTSIENHSGIVDAHRNFKADPAIIRRATEPEMLAVRARHLVVAKGDTGIADVFLINETGRTGPQNLTFTVRDAAGKTLATRTATVAAEGGDVYGQLLQAGLEFPTPDAGMLTLRAELTPVGGGKSLRREEQVLVVDVRGAAIPKRIAVLEPGQAIANTLASTFGVQPLGAAGLSGPLDAVVVSPATAAAPEKPVDPDAPTDTAGPQATATPAATPDWEGQLNALLPRVSGEGVRLVLWPDTAASAEEMARALARRGVVQFHSRIGEARASWMGSWNFVRRHWLFEGLPTDCAMDWRYQVGADRFDGGGLLLDAPGIEVMVGYSRDHEPGVGIGACVIPYGRGKIVLFCLPGLRRALEGEARDIHPVIARRLLGNAVRD